MCSGTAYDTTVPIPGKPRFKDAEDTAITIEWDSQPHLKYRVQYKEYPQTWEQAESVDVAQGENQLIASVPNLQPCSTYCLRLIAMTEDGRQSAPSEETVLDTQAASCTPKGKKRKNCIVQ